MIVCTKSRALEVEERDGVQVVTKAEAMEVSFGCGGHSFHGPLVPGDIFYMTIRQDGDPGGTLTPP